MFSCITGVAILLHHFNRSTTQCRIYHAPNDTQASDFRRLTPSIAHHPEHLGKRPWSIWQPDQISVTNLLRDRAAHVIRECHHRPRSASDPKACQLSGADFSNMRPIDVSTMIVLPSDRGRPACP